MTARAAHWVVSVVAGVPSPILKRVVMSKDRSGQTSSDRLRVELTEAKRLLAEQEAELEQSRADDRKRELRLMIKDAVTEANRPIVARLERLEGVASGEVPIADSQRLRLAQSAEEQRPLGIFRRMSPGQQGATYGGGGVTAGAFFYWIIDLLTR